MPYGDGDLPPVVAAEAPDSTAEPTAASSPPAKAPRVRRRPLLNPDRCVVYPFQCSRAGREALIQAFPELAHAERPLVRLSWLVAQHVLFPRKLCKRTGWPVLTYGQIRDMYGARHNTLNTEEVLLEIQTVLPIKWTKPHSSGSARSVRLNLPPEVDAMLHADRSPAGDGQRVFFRDGAPVTQRERNKRLHAWKLTLRRRSENVPKDHPMRDLYDLLERPQGALRKVVRQNIGAVKDASEEMEPACRRDAARVVARVLEDCPDLYYAASPRSPRLHAIGYNLNQLPRDLRKLLLSGCEEIDLAHAQLSLIAKLWGARKLLAFLEETMPGGSHEDRKFWAVLINDLGADPKKAKPTLKRGIYSLAFGMKAENIRTLLVNGVDEDPGLPEPVADGFLRNPFVEELFAARKVQMKSIKQAGGATDAFGRWIALPPKRKGHDAAASVLAQVVQSHEQALMNVIVPIIAADKNIHIVTFLHDGATLWITDRAEEDRIKARLERTVNEAARSRGFPTYLDVTTLHMASGSRNPGRRELRGGSEFELTRPQQLLKPVRGGRVHRRTRSPSRPT